MEYLWWEEMLGRQSQDREMSKDTTGLIALIRPMHCWLVRPDESLQTVNSSGGKKGGKRLCALIASVFQRELIVDPCATPFLKEKSTMKQHLVNIVLFQWLLKSKSINEDTCVCKLENCFWTISVWICPLKKQFNILAARQKRLEIGGASEPGFVRS